jgi:carbonic anhydrase
MPTGMRMRPVCEGINPLRDIVEGASHFQQAIAPENFADLPERERTEAMTQVHVLTQMANLRTLPPVAARLAKGKLRLHGWVYHIGSSEILVWNRETHRFGRIDGGEPLHFCPELRLEA